MWNMNNYVRMSIFPNSMMAENLVVLRTSLHTTVPYVSAYGHGNDRGRMGDRWDAKHVQRTGRARQKWDAKSEEESESRLRLWGETEDSGEATRLKVNKKLGFIVKSVRQRQAALDSNSMNTLMFGIHLHTACVNITWSSHGTETSPLSHYSLITEFHSISPLMIIICLVTPHMSTCLTYVTKSPRKYNFD